MSLSVIFGIIGVSVVATIVYIVLMIFYPEWVGISKAPWKQKKEDETKQ